MFRPRNEIIRVPVKKAAESNQVTTYSCDICGEGCWCSETEVDFHINLSHKDEILKLIKTKNGRNVCLVCYRKQHSVKTLVCHYKETHLLSSPTATRVEREIFICDFCNQIFFNKVLLEVHIFQRHMKAAVKHKLRCPLCLKVIQPRAMVWHLRTHSIQSTSCCPICLKKCVNKVAMHKHITEMHRKHFSCNICGFTTTREDIFNRHLQTYLNKPYTLGGGKRCERFFLKPRKSTTNIIQALRYGLKGLDLYNNIHICVLCRQICSTFRQKVLHILRDHNCVTTDTPKKVHQCSCGETFMNAVLLKHHLFKINDPDHFEARELDQTKEEEEDGNLEDSVDIEINIFTDKPATETIIP